MFSMSQIRDRSHIVLWLLLFFFILSMTVAGLVGGANILNIILGGRNTQLYVGKIGNRDISRQAFQAERDRQINQMRNQGREIDDRAYLNAGDFAWNAILERVLKDKKIEELDLRVSNDEINEFLFLNPPPAFQTDLIEFGYFADSLGNFDLDEYHEAFQDGRLIQLAQDNILLNQRFNQWKSSLRTWLADRKLQSLYNNLGSVSDELVRTDFIKKNQNCTLDYLYVNFSNIADSLVEVTEKQLRERYKEDKEESYALQERRSMEYLLFKPKPQTSVKIGGVNVYRDTLDTAAKQDLVNTEALLFAEEAEYSSFAEALAMFELTISDTFDVHETFETNSGIPFQLGPVRLAVRFAFDNSIGSISDPINTNAGLAVFHILDKKDAGFKELAEVKENLRRTLLRENKKSWAADYLKSYAQTPDNWEETAGADSLLEFKGGESSTLGGTFPGIGKSSQLTGTLLAMEPGGVSTVVETFSSSVLLQMTARDLFDDEKFQEEYGSIRTQLLATERSRGYSNWLNEAKKKIEIDDFRSIIY